MAAKAESMTNTEFLARVTLGLPLASSRFFSKHFVRLDAMHVIDHRGVVGVVAGSLIGTLVAKESRLGRTQQLRLTAINKFMDEHYEQHPVSSRMVELRLSDLKSADGWHM